MRPEILLPARKCTLGCPILDEFLAGGIPCGSITELSGESGSGKTQLSLQLLLCAQLPLSLGGLLSSSLYLHSELPYPFRRFEQLSKAFYLSYPQVFESYKCVCDNVLVQELHSAEHLFEVLLKLDSTLAESHKKMPIKLIVIDSIAALFRSEFENTPFDLRRRSSLFFKISSKLKLVAKRYEVAVLVTNQVVDVMRSSGDLNGLKIGNFDYLYSSGRRVCPALGISWANCVNSRLFLSINEEVTGNATGEDNLLCKRIKRQMHVVFAPHLPGSSCEYVINREGVFGVRGQVETSVSATSFKSDATKDPTFLLCD